jgi:hypothetical protein
MVASVLVLVDRRERARRVAGWLSPARERMGLEGARRSVRYAMYMYLLGRSGAVLCWAAGLGVGPCRTTGWNTAK